MNKYLKKLASIPNKQVMVAMEHILGKRVGVRTHPHVPIQDIKLKGILPRLNDPKHPWIKTVDTGEPTRIKKASKDE